MNKTILKKIALAFIIAPFILSIGFYADGPFDSKFAQFFYKNAEIIVFLYCIVWICISCIGFPEMNYIAVSFAVLTVFLYSGYNLYHNMLFSGVDGILEDSATLILMVAGFAYVAEKMPKK